MAGDPVPPAKSSSGNALGESPTKSASAVRYRSSHAQSLGLGSGGLTRARSSLKGPNGGLCPSLNPEESPLLKQWDLMSAFLLVLVAFLTPLEAGFLGCAAPPRFALNQFINVFFGCDLVLQFFLPYQATVGKTHVTIHMPCAIVKHYLRTWFFLDFVSVFPYELIAPCGQASKGGLDLGFLRAVRMMRLLKLLKLLRGFRMFARWQLEFGISKRKTTLYVIICFVIVAAHWIACILGLLSKIQAGSGDACFNASDSEARDCVITWLTNAAGWYDTMENGNPYSELNNYLVALHASMSILVHPHSYAPTSIIERVSFSLLMLLGGFIWTQVISRSTAMVTSLDRHNIAFASLMDDVNLISSDHGLPHEIRRRLRKYFLKMKDASKEETWKTIMKRMSPKLRQDCAKEINRVWVLSIRFMSQLNRNPAVLAEIAESLMLEGFSEGETFGEPHHLYILREGNALLRKPNSQEFRVLIPGSVWGEDHLLLTCGDMLSDNTAKAMNYVSVQSLAKKDFDAVIRLYPAEEASIRKVTVKYAVIQGIMRHVERTNERARPEVDHRDMDAHDLAHRARHRVAQAPPRPSSQSTRSLAKLLPQPSSALEELAGKVDRLASQQDALMDQHERLLNLVERIAAATGVADGDEADPQPPPAGASHKTSASRWRPSAPSSQAAEAKDSVPPDKLGAQEEKTDSGRMAGLRFGSAALPPQREDKAVAVSDGSRSDLGPFEVYI